MKKSIIDFFIILMCCFTTLTFAEFPQTSGFFIISGYTNSTLLWLPFDQLNAVDLGTLGVIPNRVIWNGQYLLIVNSGNFAGFNSSIWYVHQTQLIQAINQNVPLQWSVVSFPQFTNAYDAVIVGNRTFVTALGTSQIIEVDLVNHAIVRAHPTVANPQDILLTAEGLYVAGSGFGTGNQIARHNLVTLSYDSITVGYNPQGMVKLQDGTLVVACAGASWVNPPLPGNIVAILPNQEIVSSTPTPNFSPTTLGVSSQNRILAGGEYGSPNLVQLFVSNQSIQYVPITNVAGGSQIIADSNDEVWISSTLNNSITKYNQNWNVIQTIQLSQVPAYIAYHNPMLSDNDQLDVLIPHTIQLLPCYPNPFNQTVQIPFYLSKKQKVTINVYNLLGEYISTVESKTYPIGYQRVEWSPTSLSSGNYIIQFQTERTIQSAKVQFLK